jgi:hypothetical protein
MTQAAQQADQVIAAHVAAKVAKVAKKEAQVAKKALKKQEKTLKKQEKALKKQEKKQVKEANKLAKKKSKKESSSSPSTTLCAREECSFLTHSNGKIGFGSHCCHACKLKGRHGPSCERVWAVPQPVEEEQPPAALSLSNPEVLAVAEVFCPTDHKLVQFQTTHGKFYCDDCKAKVKQGTTLFGCRQCDYDLCEVCVAQAVSSRVPTPALTPHVSVEEVASTEPQPEEKVKGSVSVDVHVEAPLVAQVVVEEENKHESGPEDATFVPAAKAQAPVDPDVAKFASQLAALRNMGFEETNLNLYLLKRNKGVVSQVVNWYLDNAQV